MFSKESLTTGNMKTGTLSIVADTCCLPLARSSKDLQADIEDPSAGISDELVPKSAKYASPLADSKRIKREKDFILNCWENARIEMGRGGSKCSELSNTL
jgi:hypothetical protein